ncbi:MAG: outer membrane protein assembly factor BamD [Hyphomicrobiales bacterium]
MTRPYQYFGVVFALISAIALGSCSSRPGAALSAIGSLPPNSDMKPADGSRPIAKLYDKGLSDLADGEYKNAAARFEEVERQYPYSGWATRAMLMAAYCHYQRNDYAATIDTAQRFISLHRGHKDVVYAYYLIALSYYEQISDIHREQSMARKALSVFQEVIRRFPRTPYARQAKAKLLSVRDHLAAKDVEVGRYYLKRKAYVAAINRFKTVVSDYPATLHVPEALYRLVEAYTALGVPSQAEEAASVLGQRYPASSWYRDARAILRSVGKNSAKQKSPDRQGS